MAKFCDDDDGIRDDLELEVFCLKGYIPDIQAAFLSTSQHPPPPSGKPIAYTFIDVCIKRLLASTKFRAKSPSHLGVMENFP